MYFKVCYLMVAIGSCHLFSCPFCPSRQRTGHKRLPMEYTMYLFHELLWRGLVQQRQDSHWFQSPSPAGVLGPHYDVSVRNFVSESKWLTQRVENITWIWKEYKLSVFRLLTIVFNDSKNTNIQDKKEIYKYTVSVTIKAVNYQTALRVLLWQEWFIDTQHQSVQISHRGVVE